MSKILVSSHWLHSHFEDENMVILDATQEDKRSKLPLEFRNLMIKGSRFFDIKNDFSDTESPFPNTFPSKEKFESSCSKLGVNNDSIIVIYDALGVFSSARVWWLFKTFGHQQVFVLNGGLPDWINHKFPTEKRQKKIFDNGNFKVKLNPKNVWFFKDVKENIDTKSCLVIDARSKKRFESLIAEPRRGLRRGNIPNSKNLPFTEVLKDGKFKSVTELKILFAAFDQSKPFVFSCGSGITACILLIASELALSNQNIIYDGSWTEFGTLEQ